MSPGTFFIELNKYIEYTHKCNKHINTVNTLNKYIWSLYTDSL